MINFSQMINFLFILALNVSPVSLERALIVYNQNVTEKAFDIKTIPTIDATQTETQKGIF
jgi:hypothetical protein